LPRREAKAALMGEANNRLRTTPVKGREKPFILRKSSLCAASAAHFVGIDNINITGKHVQMMNHAGRIQKRTANEF